MTVKGTPLWPVNEANEIVVQAGSGTTTVTGFVPANQIATDVSTNKVVMKLPDLDAIVLAEPITGFVSGVGTVASTDTVLQAFNKLDGNDIAHLATATTNFAKTNQLLFVLRSADMHITTDQAFTKAFTGTQYRITDIFATRKTGAASVACAGGIYDTAAKGGNAVVANTQDWVSLASGVNVAPTKAAVVNTVMLAPTLFLSLTTGSTAACTADIFVYGYIVD